MDVKTAPQSATAEQKAAPERTSSSAAGWTLLFFVLFLAVFHELFRALPYVKNGSDVVFGAKLKLEEQGTIFPADATVTRVLIFGNSKILAGFLPGEFDQLSAADHHRVSSFNSGFPGSDLFLPPLKALCARGQAPNLLLLTLPWNADPPQRGLFHFILDDHALIDRLFPFRTFFRDLAAFVLNAPGHGGVLAYYHEAEAAERAVVAERGYHLITEQSRFPGGRLPSTFRLASDEPTKIVGRGAPLAGAQTRQLNQLIQQYRMECFYVPFYLREGEAAPAAAYNQRFAALVAQNTACKLIGPDYFLYPNRLFADQTHLNEEGAKIYTNDLYRLLKDNAHALQ